MNWSLLSLPVTCLMVCSSVKLNIIQVNWLYPYLLCHVSAFASRRDEQLTHWIKDAWCFVSFAWPLTTSTFLLLETQHYFCFAFVPISGHTNEWNGTEYTQTGQMPQQQTVLRTNIRSEIHNQTMKIREIADSFLFIIIYWKKCKRSHDPTEL